MFYCLVIILILNFCLTKSQRPQTPLRPYPYIDEEIKFKNIKAGIELAGTLTYSKNRTRHKNCVVLAHASGGNTRDEELAGHYTFMVLADYLTRKNIAVLRFDERGLGQSNGNFTEARFTDFSDDVLAGIDYMKTRREFKWCKFGIVGHSKGGMTAMLAAISSDNVKFIVLLGSPGIDLAEIFTKQIRLVQKSLNANKKATEVFVRFNKVCFELVKIIENRTKLREELLKTSATIMKETDESLISFFVNPWFRDSLLFKHDEVLRKIKIPVLGLYGTLDIHVSADENMIGIENGLKSAGNHNFKLVKLENLNHLFQTAKTGSPAEFGLIEETIAPIVPEIIAKWIKNTI
jgi:pimeloyl-ACP methyl ester carboxylesterase